MGNLHFKCRPHWHESQLGAQWIAALETRLQATLPTLFGFYLLQLGRENTTAWLTHSPMLQKFVVSGARTPPLPTTPLIQSEYSPLPFPNDSIDAVLLPCILETLTSPTEIIQELWRILLPGGTLILFGFNPWSLGGLLHLFLNTADEFPWQGHYWSVYQVKKWLTEANFTLDTVEYFSYSPAAPCSSSPNTTNFMEKMSTCCYHRLGGLYQINATKQVVPVVPIKPKWQMALDDSTLARPATGP